MKCMQLNVFISYTFVIINWHNMPVSKNIYVNGYWMNVNGLDCSFTMSAYQLVCEIH